MRWADRIGRQLKLRDLHILLAVVQAGSMAKAAGELSVSNPVVSKAIADLERAVGVRLLDRTPQGVTPTVYGRALLDRGVRAFDELRQAVKHIEQLADPAAGEVRIGTSAVIASGFASAVIDRLSRRHPRMVVHLLTAESAAAYRTLDERQVDLVIAHVFAPLVEPDMDVEVLYHDHQVVVAGVQNPWARRRKVALADLVNEPWTLQPLHTPAGSIVSEAFRAHGLDVPPVAVVTSTVSVRNALLARGRFLSIVPDSMARFPPGRDMLKVLPIALPMTRRPIGIITLKNRTLSPAAALFIAGARELARGMAAPQR